MEKGVFLCFAILIIAVAMVGAACSVKLSDFEKQIIGRYELATLFVESNPYNSIYNNLKASSYEYFTMEFSAKKTCIVRSKSGGNIYSQSAKWRVNNADEIEVTVTQGAYSVTEYYTLFHGVLSGTNTSTVSVGQTVTMTATFNKVA